jgi:hypothetical protein
MNVYSEHPFKVLFDYGHNAHAVSVMADLAGRLDVTGRRVVVLAGPGESRGARSGSPARGAGTQRFRGRDPR